VGWHGIHGLWRSATFTVTENERKITKQKNRESMDCGDRPRSQLRMLTAEEAYDLNDATEGVNKLLLTEME
jgi:hypothetical protein